ncbi:hypothetical protein BC628DRAFT_1348239 [Trametes gibbosa]|nr:hypothetical protein BC628DRAFT_1348239 [Trametes gibbosa]
MLPVRYISSDKERTLNFQEDEDLYLLIHRFYKEKPDPGFNSMNFIAGDLLTKRHEYVGPAPHVTDCRKRNLETITRPWGDWFRAHAVTSRIHPTTYSIWGTNDSRPLRHADAPSDASLTDPCSGSGSTTGHLFTRMPMLR